MPQQRFRSPTVVAVALAGLLLTACTSRLKKESAGQADDEPIRIGHVSPQTGALAPFGEADTS